ncbi:MAG TPA: hypothetical protein EYP11_02445 [Aquificaceae bacterium]|nr:hypothetical protein [Aquificaceae bacterium]
MRTEDTALGLFVLLALLYPLFIFLLIHNSPEEAVELEDRLRITYLFLLGFEECTRERAKEVSRFIEPSLLKELGGVDGMVGECIRNKRAGGFSLEERVIADGKGRFVEVKVIWEEGSAVMGVWGEERKGKFLVVGVKRYAKGD